MSIGSSDLANLFGSGGTKSGEVARTHELWEETQRLWHASPLAKRAPDDLALETMWASVKGLNPPPIVPILVAVCEAVEALLRAEAVGNIEPRWQLIETNIEVAVEFRQMLARRKRWAADFSFMYDTFGRVVLPALRRFYQSLPPSCFGRRKSDAADTFEVPLVELIQDPATTIDQLFVMPFAEDSFRLDLFLRLRALYEQNILTASGLRAGVDIDTVEHRLVRAPKQRDKSAGQLAELYLEGSPLKGLLDVAVPFQIPDEARFEHCHIVGGTGHGKTQLMQKMIHADLEAARKDGRSVVVIDSQGDLINKLVHLDAFSPRGGSSLASKLVLIDPSDVEFPAALNLFDAHLERLRNYGPADRERVLNGVIELYELFFGAFLGAELTQKQGVVFKYLARLMLEIPDATIYTLMRIMDDGRSFKPYIDRLDRSAQYFFESEFFHPSFAATKKQVLRRLWGVLSTPAFERMFSQAKNKLDLFDAMNSGKIILVSTAKDLLKREGSQLLGRFVIAMIAQAALERSTIKERDRRPVFVYVDEAQEYFDDSIETILNQARKYRVGITLAHQTLDQLAPRLRSTILANTSVKCVGGVSARDAGSLAAELHTTSDFIEGMKRRGERTEFALWVKQLTGQAIRLAVPLGFLERQPTLSDEDYDALIKANRARYCGTLAEVSRLGLQETEAPAAEPPAHSARDAQAEPDPREAPPDTRTLSAPHINASQDKRERSGEPDAERAIQPVHTKSRDIPDLGKGGKQHRYLQSLVKELAEQGGLRATIEAPLALRNGQVDVLLEREGLAVAVEISVTTPVEHERENLRKCLDAGFAKIAVVLAKSRASLTSYRNALSESIAEAERERVHFLTPEQLPDFILSLVQPPQQDERVVKGYRVKGAFVETSPEEARARQAAVARLIAKSLSSPS